MNIDCHYYGTYYIARMAGFSQDDALQIAWAAQTVDECHIKNLKDIREKIDKDDFLLTITHPRDDKRDTLAVLGNLEYSEVPSPVPSSRLTAIRAIWMPFHFLPGNFKPAVSEVNVKKFRCSDFIVYPAYVPLVPLVPYGYMRKYRRIPPREQDDDDLKLMCRTSTGTCKLMIENAKNQYNALIETNREQALFAVGIVMHVLADTWSHEYFCGSPSYFINYVESDIKTFCGNTVSISTFGPDAISITAKLSSSPHVIETLGHGIAGYYPDLPFIRNYVISPKWLDAAPIGQRSLPNRDNCERFQNAFCQMLMALKYIKGDPNYDTEWVPYTFRRYKKEYDDKFKSKNASDAVNYISCLQKVKVFVFQACESPQTAQWNKKIIEEELYYGYAEMDDGCGGNYEYTKLPEYSFDQDNTDRIINFLRMAKKHRDTVLTYVNKHVSRAFVNESSTFDLNYIHDMVIEFYETMK